MAITKKDANAKYDKLRKQLKIGAIDKETFKRSANAIYKKYHSKANKATRNAPTSKPKASKPQQSKPAANKSKPAETKRKPETKNKKSGSGIKGEFRKVGTPGPNVTVPFGKLDRNTARVRRHQQDARRSRTAQHPDVKAASGSSSTKGRANIRRMVNEQSGSSKRNQRQVEDKRRRARARGAKRNRRLMLSRRYNDS